MNKQSLENKVSESFKILEMPVKISPGEEFYEKIYPGLISPNKQYNSIKYLLIAFMFAMGILSGIYLGNNFNENKSNLEETTRNLQNDNSIYPLEKIILGSDYN